MLSRAKSGPFACGCVRYEAFARKTGYVSDLEFKSGRVLMSQGVNGSVRSQIATIYHTHVNMHILNASTVLVSFSFVDQ